MFQLECLTKDHDAEKQRCDDASSSTFRHSTDLQIAQLKLIGPSAFWDPAGVEVQMPCHNEGSYKCVHTCLICRSAKCDGACVGIDWPYLTTWLRMVTSRWEFSDD